MVSDRVIGRCVSFLLGMQLAATWDLEPPGIQTLPSRPAILKPRILLLPVLQQSQSHLPALLLYSCRPKPREGCTSCNQPSSAPSRPYIDTFPVRPCTFSANGPNQYEQLYHADKAVSSPKPVDPVAYLQPPHSTSCRTHGPRT
jgi:hypothetical protein